MKKIAGAGWRFVIHTVTKHSNWWNLWDQSLTAAYLYHLRVMLRRMVQRMRDRLAAPLARIRKNSLVHRAAQTIRRRWRTMVLPWRRKLQLQGVMEAFILVLITVLPVLKNGYLVTLGLVLFLFYGGSKSYRPGRCLLWFMGLILAGALFSPGYRNGWDSLAGLMNGLIMAYLVASAFSASLVNRAVRYLVTFSTVLMVIGLWQKWADIATPSGWLEPAQIGVIGPRIFSIFTNPNIYAIYLVSIMALASYLWLETKGQWQKWGWGTITVGALLSLYFTYSRSGWLIGLIYLGLFSCKIRRKQLFYSSLAVAFLVIALVVGSEAGSRLLTLSSLTGATLGYRSRIWQGTIKALSDFWLWGAGPDGFARVYPWHQIGNTAADHAHQWYLQFWLEYGLLGLTGFGWLLAHLFKPFPMAGWRRTLGMTILCFLGFGLVESWYVHPFLGNYFWLLIGMFLAINPEGTV